jgi:hypothetical protein
LISTPSKRSAASTGAAVIRQRGSDQIIATVTGLGGGAANTSTVNVPSHGPGVPT